MVVIQREHDTRQDQRGAEILRGGGGGKRGVGVDGARSWGGDGGPRRM